MRKIAIVAALVLLAAPGSADAGPFKKLRDRVRGNSCSAPTSSCTTNSQVCGSGVTVSRPATQWDSYPVAAAYTTPQWSGYTVVQGCANGKCPLPTK